MHSDKRAVIVTTRAVTLKPGDKPLGGVRGTRM